MTKHKRAKPTTMSIENLCQDTVHDPAGEIKHPPAETSFSADLLDILDALPFYVLLVDSDHYIIHANKTVQAQLGLDPKQIVGSYCPKVIHGIDTPFFGCPLEEAAAKGQAVEREVFDSKSGRWLMSAVYPTQRYTQNGKRVFFHLVTDITERKQAEEQLRASHERLRILSAHLETIREDERKRIARDLHDETSQLVASLSAHLEAAANLLPATESKAKAVIKKAQELSVSILDELHRVIYELHPFLLDDLGLVAATESLIDNTLKTARVKVKFRATGNIRRLDRQIEITLYRVIQEALSNIIMHAAAKNVGVNIRFQKKSIKVCITDDGIGFEIKEDIDGKPSGFGIRGMRERIELINGNLNIRSSLGSGTEITIEVPSENGARITQTGT